MRRWSVPVAAALLVVGLAGCASEPRLPAGFPTAVPVLPGTVLATKHQYGEWLTWVRSAHPLKDYRTARKLLLDAHYSETANDETAGGSTGQFCSPTWCTNLTGYHDPHYGDSVSYEVFRTTGMNAVG